jgi:hypothetical protein
MGRLDASTPRVGRREAFLALLLLGGLAACEAPPSHEAGRTATSDLLQGGTVTFSVPLPSGTSMSQVVVGASASILTGAPVEISPETGTALPLVVNTGTGTTTINANSKVTSSVWSKGNVFLGSSTSVSGYVKTAGTVTQQTGVTVGGGVTEHQTLTTANTSWTVTFPSSSTDVTLPMNAVDSRPPGAYATVSISQGAKLTFQSGTYYLDSLNIEPSGQLILSGQGPFVIYVRSSLTVKGPFVVPLTSLGTPARFVLGFAGTSDVYFSAQIDGTLIAPNANVILAQLTTPYHGAFFGKNITLQGSVKIQQRDADVKAHLVPVAECVIPNADGSYKAVFGYNATSLLGAQASIPVGASNTFGPAPANRGQPTTFKPGRQTAQFGVNFDGKSLTWTLDGSSSTANALLPTCVASCVQQIVDPTKPRIDTPLTTAAAPLSVDESTAMRTSFRWDDTLPVPEAYTDGTPRLYYATIYLSSPNTLQALDALRIHYSNNPLFEDEMASLEAQGISEDFSYPHDGHGQFVFAIVPGAVYNAVRAAALDPTNPTELFRAVYFRPIPPNDSGYQSQATCALTPVAQCVAQAANGSLRAVFSYSNPSGAAVTVPVGAANGVTGGSAAVTLPEAFAAGAHNAVFAVPFNTGSTVTWSLNGLTASATAATARCSATVVSQIGVDVYNPFPTPAQPSCRYPTPGEAQNPGSKLPPAARANTCMSMMYTYAETLGMKWRGVDSDADDVDGLAADAALDAGDATMTAMSLSSGTSSGGTTTMQSALFGKLFRKIVHAVAKVAKGAVDLVRKGLQAGAGLFIGSTNRDFGVELQNIDPAFAGTPMQQSWGKDFGRPIALTGVTMRATRSVFLSTDKLHAGQMTIGGALVNNVNQGRVNILHHMNGVRICFENENPAGRVMNGFLPVTSCPSGLTAGSAGPDILRFTSRNLNMTAQMTDVRNYMSAIGGLQLAQAEVISGTVADLIGRLNTNRAFTPCFGFSWNTDVPTFMTALGAVAGDQLNQLTDPYIRSGADAIFKAMTTAVGTLVDVGSQIESIAASYAGTALEATANAARDAVNNAINVAKATNTQAQVLAEEASDYIDAMNTASNLAQQNNPRAQAAQAAVKTTIDNVNAQAAVVANTALNDVQTAANQAFNALDALAQAIPAADTRLQQVLNLKGVVNGITQVAKTLFDTATNVVIKAKDVAVQALTTYIGAFIGHTIGEVFEFFAGGDIIMPSAKGDNSNLERRGVMTHEFGHYSLCNLMNTESPGQFVQAYNEAAALGLITNQSPSATSAVMNESFADLIASQVVGGTNYAQPHIGSLSVADPDVFDLGGLSYCNASGTTCIETNYDNLTVIGGGTKQQFTDLVLRNVSMYVDTLDGQPSPLVPTDLSGNGNVTLATAFNGNNFATNATLASSPGAVAAPVDEVVAMAPGALRAWVRRTFARGTLLHEDNVFGGLNDTMQYDYNYNWCQRCEIFYKHTKTSGVSNCPEAWVGPRPTVNLVTSTQPLGCSFEPTCAPAQQELDTRYCTPTCPTDYTWDSASLSCVKTGVVR